MQKIAHLFLVPAALFAIGWPVGQMDKARPIGSGWGEIQTITSELYLHPGVDIMGVTPGQPAYAVSSGVVKSWFSLGGEWAYELSIADSATNDSCDGWIYVHIDPGREHKMVGDHVEEGDLLGYLYMAGGYDHLHLARIRGAGEIWWVDWMCIDNPTGLLVPPGDTVAPIFEDALKAQLLAFRRNNGTKYLSPDSLFGDVDIIARIHDKTGIDWSPQDTVWKRLVPVEAWYEIHGMRTTPPVRSFLLDGELQWLTNIDAIYSIDNTCHSRGSPQARDFYFILTNTDGDSLREVSDYDSCWHTAQLPDGDYWVVVTAKDAVGNTSKDSMRVTLVNGTGVGERPSDDLKAFELLTRIIFSGNPLRLVSRTQSFCRIYDASGRELINVQLRPSASVQEVLLGDLPAGVYFVKIEPEVSGTYKFIVVR